MDPGLGEFGGQALAIPALEIREDDQAFALEVAPVDRAGSRKRREVDMVGGRLDRRFVASRRRVTGYARRTGREQIGIEFEQAGGSDVAPFFHVVETAYEQVAGGLVDVEQRVTRDDFAPGPERVAADRIDRGLGQPQFQCLRDIARHTGSARRHSGDGRDAERQHGGGAREGKGKVGGAGLQAWRRVIVVHLEGLLTWTPSRKTISTSMPVGISTTGWYCSARSMRYRLTVSAASPAPWPKPPARMSVGDSASR